MSDTPRTDAEYKISIQLYPQSLSRQDVVAASFARQLERELAAKEVELSDFKRYYDISATALREAESNLAKLQNVAHGISAGRR